MNDFLSGKKHLNLFSLFLGTVILVIAANCAELWPATVKMAKQRKESPFYFSGFKFLGLEDIFLHTAYVGYYTDKDVAHDKQAAAEFGQAQYILAPTILDLNNPNHEFFLFNCSNESVAFKKIKEIKAIPLKKNAFGVILARKTQ